MWSYVWAEIIVISWYLTISTYYLSSIFGDYFSCQCDNCSLYMIADTFVLMIQLNIIWCLLMPANVTITPLLFDWLINFHMRLNFYTFQSLIKWLHFCPLLLLLRMLFMNWYFFKILHHSKFFLVSLSDCDLMCVAKCINFILKSPRDLPIFICFFRPSSA